MKPMLAKKYADFQHRIQFPLWVQPKLNGVRGMFHAGRMQSRDEIYWNDNVVEHVISSLKDLPSTIILDGEFYFHGWPLQKINGAISINRNAPSAHTSWIQYHVFDCIDLQDIDLPFSKRYQLLERHLPIDGSVQLVQTYPADDPITADQWYAHFKEQEYEGMMYRLDEPYGLEFSCGNKENRWHRLLKRKEWLDEDCVILNVEVGTGKYSNSVGALVCQFPNGAIFTAGSGLSDLQRLKYMDQPPIGFTVKIQYEMLSVDGIPLKPTVLAVFD